MPPYMCIREILLTSLLKTRDATTVRLVQLCYRLDTDHAIRTVPQLVLKGQPGVPLVVLASLLGSTLVEAVVVICLEHLASWFQFPS